MKKSVGRLISQCIVASLSGTIITLSMIALRHAIETPQVLKSTLPGESFLYRWKSGMVFYKVHGKPDAPPLLLLHTPAIGSSAHEMRSLVEPLARTHRVYIPDLPGFGLSDRPAMPYTAELYTSLCQDFVRDVIQQPTTLIASGLSCNYVVSLAAHTPENCKALVLLSPIALHGLMQKPSLVRYLLQRTSVKALLYPILCTRLAFLLSRVGERNSSADFAQFYAATHQLGAEHAALDLLSGNLSTDISAEFESLPQPVLIIWGAQALNDQQNIASLHDASQKRQDREVELIQDAGLLVHLEQPAKVVTSILRWQPVFIETASPQEESRQSEQPELVTNEEQTTASPFPAGEADTQPETTPDTFTETARPSTIQAYCVKCKQKREILDAHEILMKNGRPAVRGTCSVCGTGIHRIGKLNPS